MQSSELIEACKGIVATPNIPSPLYYGTTHYGGDSVETEKDDKVTIGVIFDEPEQYTEKVEHPRHYTEAYPNEVIDIIRTVLSSVNLPPYEAYCFGNELKYRLRAGWKGDANEDIGKAMKYNEFRRGRKD